MSETLSEEIGRETRPVRSAAPPTVPRLTVPRFGVPRLTVPRLTAVAVLAAVLMEVLTVGSAAVADSSGPASATGERPKANRLGQPTRLWAEPARAALSGPWQRVQFLISSEQPDGSVRDLTAAAEWSVFDPKIATVSAGRVAGLANGSTTVTAKLGSQTLTLPVTVGGFAPAPAVSFHNEIKAALTRGGCNSGACHGTPTGKGGFHLSLRGWEPDYDYVKIVREGGARRVNVLDPDDSLLLAKPLGALPHMGGVRWSADSLEHNLLRTWIAEGAGKDDANADPLQELEITPGGRVLTAPDTVQQLRVVGRFAKSGERDVTALCVFSVSNEEVASVDATGKVTGHGRGEVAVLARYLDAVRSVRLTFLLAEPATGPVKWAAPPANNFIDEHVLAKLAKLRIPPSELAGDSVFLRRVYLDAIGRLPTVAEARAFLSDRSPDKRAKLIDALLARPEFADFWTAKWADVLKVSEEALGTGGTLALHGWLRSAVAADKPVNDWVRDLLTAEGSTHDNPPANFHLAFRDAETAAEGTAQLFLGVRMQCARCHNHPSEIWTQDDYYHLAAFFAPVGRKAVKGKNPKHPRDKIPEMMISVDPKSKLAQPRTGEMVVPQAPGSDVRAGGDDDPRPTLANWLVRPDNPFLAKAVSNRLWYHIFGRGIVEPPDDFRESNPPADDALMEALAAEFRRGGTRIRPLVRLILNSRTYQLASEPNAVNAGDRIYFSHYQPRLLSAEVLLDAVCDVTEVPEKFAAYPNVQRAVQLPGREANHPFLEGFNKPPRRLPCECERQKEPNLTQALQFISGRLVHNKLRADKGRIARLAASAASSAEIAEELYLATLSRFPTERERTAVAELLTGLSGAARREAVEDLAWALLNTKEFLFQH